MYTMMNYPSYPVGMQAGFKDFGQFVRDLEKALEGEREAIDFYAELIKLAPNELAAEQVKMARDDEIKHFNMFSRLYVSLTGRPPVVRPPVIQLTHFCTGIHEAILDELGAYELYRDMYLATTIPHVRDIMFEALTDEIEHATRFNLVYSGNCISQQ